MTLPGLKQKGINRHACSKGSFIDGAYVKLYRHFGPQHWWPAQTPFEVIVGAILTQNTNWSNVEKALVNLRKKKVLSAKVLYRLSHKNLSDLIRPAGYFNVKATRIKNFLDYFFKVYNGQIALMKKKGISVLRNELLSVNGIGPETADSILLYALKKKTFVSDAYTKRFLSRHNVVDINGDYHTIKALFENSLPKKALLYNEYHALIVRLGKVYCKTKPDCEHCPIRPFQNELDRQCMKCFRFFRDKEKIYSIKNIKEGYALCKLCKNGLSAS